MFLLEKKKILPWNYFIMFICLAHVIIFSCSLEHNHCRAFSASLVFIRERKKVRCSFLDENMSQNSTNCVEMVVHHNIWSFCVFLYHFNVYVDRDSLKTFSDIMNWFAIRERYYKRFLYEIFFHMQSLSEDLSMAIGISWRNYVAF